MNRKGLEHALVLAFAGILIAACAAGCGPASAAPEATERAAPEAGVFKLGVLGPFTGPSASTGTEYKGAVTMALEAVDWRIRDYAVEVIWIDSQSDPEAAAQAYERAILEEGIQAAILNWHSSVAVACMDVAADYEIPHIFPYGASEVVNEKFLSNPDRYGYWMNKGWPVPAKLTTAYVEAIEDAITEGRWLPEEKTLAVFAEDTAWGRSFGAAIKTQFETAGWTTVAEEYSPLEQVNFYPSLNKLKALNVALVAGTSTSMPQFAAFINQADEVGLESMIIADGLGWAGEWYRMTGDASDYAIDQIPGWATSEGQAFAEAFEEQWGVAPSPSAAGLAYDGTTMFIEIARRALEEHGQLTSESIYTWGNENLQTGKWSFTDGIVMASYTYTPDTLPDPVVGKGYYIFPVRQYLNGEGKIVFPPEWAEAKLIREP